MRKMAGCLVCALMLMGCQTDFVADQPTVKEKKVLAQEKLAQTARQVIQGWLKKKEYSFQLELMSGKRRFTGKQVADNWSLKDAASQKLVMRRNGEHIYAYHDSGTEMMTVKQAGLVSPRDHLSFVLSVAGKFRQGTAEWVNGRRVDVIEVDIDNGKLLDKLKQALFSNETVRLPVNMAVTYKLAVQDARQLTKVTLIIREPDRGQVQQLTYQLM
ncbi:hypothetical protein [Laceyella sacchari]|jgi:hypothetical protein|uniref:Outer membrane lipoprotein-sorting protein n=1 Tax=Laceyella sacchari TaxID=37482 RepID=A0ABY5U613_LACSH|nr:hypothetical protein [Laceyella sacchari]TCW41534.1 hypothetical protein EDC32_1011200 [Laceyella sacchari]UWE05093.1 hypothetical protein NYR52_08255 [Laceyella sacchari]